MHLGIGVCEHCGLFKCGPWGIVHDDENKCGTESVLAPFRKQLILEELMFCSTCGFQSTLLRDHVLHQVSRHGGIQTYNCNMCYRPYVSSRALGFHAAKTHGGVKRWEFQSA